MSRRDYDITKLNTVYPNPAGSGIEGYTGVYTYNWDGTENMDFYIKLDPVASSDITILMIVFNINIPETYYRYTVSLWSRVLVNLQRVIITTEVNSLDLGTMNINDFVFEDPPIFAPPPFELCFNPYLRQGNSPIRLANFLGIANCKNVSLFFDTVSNDKNKPLKVKYALGSNYTPWTVYNSSLFYESS